MFTTVKKNRKVFSLLVFLLFIVGFHLFLAYLYEDSDDYVINNYKDASFEIYNYALTVLAIFGGIILIISKNIFIKLISFILFIPKASFLLFLMKAYQLNEGDKFISLKNYHDYLFLMPFLADAVLILIIAYIITLSFKKAP
jgi:hypothetical protein